MNKDVFKEINLKIILKKFFIQVELKLKNHTYNKRVVFYFIFN